MSQTCQWMRCTGEVKDGVCEVCGKRPYYESISIGRGGGVGRCWECKQTNLIRFVSETTNMCGDLRDTNRYRLCDRCTDREVAEVRRGGGKVSDGRESIQPLTA